MAITIEEAIAELPENRKRNIEDIRVLFPYLNFTERMEWISVIRSMSPELYQMDLGNIVNYLIDNNSG